MNDQDLFKKLNNLRNIKPDQAWKKSCRDILYSQISASRTAVIPKSNTGIVWERIMSSQILMSFTRPVWLASAASVLILVVGIGGVYASKNTKPGDSLYIAKIISEKAKFAITFDEKDKARLGLEFASNRAKEMLQVIKDSGQSEEANNKLEQLSQDFKKEISQVKNRLSIINVTKNQTKAGAEEAEVFGANLGKDNQRMEISSPTASVPVEPADNNTVIATTSEPIIENQVLAGATSTPEITDSADRMLEQAEKFFDEKNLSGTINKLEEVNKAIGDAGKVQGASETASSTN